MDYQNFYSDPLADTPMALCAEKTHLITNKAQTVNDWPKLDVLQCPEPIRAKIKLAIDELFGNICFYAYDSAPGPVTVCMENETWICSLKVIVPSSDRLSIIARDITS